MFFASCVIFHGIRQLQGILKSSCAIEGRVKLEEFQRIVNKINTLRNDPRCTSKKHIAVFKMFVHGADRPGSHAADAYAQFCTEFTRDKRVALSNLGGGSAQLYVVPPELQDCLSMFATLDAIPDSLGSSTAVLYGLITSKEVGPAKYVNATAGTGAAMHTNEDTAASSVLEGGFTLEEPVFGTKSNHLYVSSAPVFY